jgi:hypothetical protein
VRFGSIIEEKKRKKHTASTWLTYNNFNRRTDPQAVYQGKSLFEGSQSSKIAKVDI